MAYFGELVIDGNSYKVGSSLFGVCNTSANTREKVVATTDTLGSIFTDFIYGITVNIQFTKGNTVEDITLAIGNTIALPVHGNAKCNANALLSFTYGIVGGNSKWILNAGEKTATTVMQTYDSSSSEPISGRGVAEAIAPLVPGGNSAANYSVDTSIGAFPSANKVPTSAAVANYVNNAFNEKNALIYKGNISSGSYIPTSGYQAGWIYKIAQAGTFIGQKCEIGDLLMAVADGNDSNSTIVTSDWVIIQTNIQNPVSGPNSATEGHIATFGANAQALTDSGYTISTSVPANAVFTDTQYEDKGTVQAVTGIEEGTEFTFASVVSGALNIKRGITLNKATVSIGIQEVT